MPSLFFSLSQGSCQSKGHGSSPLVIRVTDVLGCSSYEAARAYTLRTTTGFWQRFYRLFFLVDPIYSALGQQLWFTNCVDLTICPGDMVPELLIVQIRVQAKQRKGSQCQREHMIESKPRGAEGNLFSFPLLDFQERRTEPSSHYAIPIFSISHGKGSIYLIKPETSLLQFHPIFLCFSPQWRFYITGN